MEPDTMTVVCGLILANLTGALAGIQVGRREGRKTGFAAGADSQIAPKGPPVLNEDIMAMCKHPRHERCRGRGIIGTELCLKARQTFERRYLKDDIVAWNGRLHWREPRT